MILAHVERYTIRQEPTGLVIAMRQWKGALACTAFALGMLALMMWKVRPSLVTSRHDTMFWAYWLFYSVAGMFAALGLVGVFYQEQYVISDTEIVQTNSFSTGQRRLPRGQVLKLRVQIMPDTGKNRPPLPCRIYLLNPTEQESGLRFEFTASQHMDQFLHALRMSLPLDVEDLRVSHGPV